MDLFLPVSDEAVPGDTFALNRTQYTFDVAALALTEDEVVLALQTLKFSDQANWTRTSFHMFFCENATLMELKPEGPQAHRETTAITVPRHSNVFLEVQVAGGAEEGPGRRDRVDPPVTRRVCVRCRRQGQRRDRTSLPLRHSMGMHDVAGGGFYGCLCVCGGGCNSIGVVVFTVVFDKEGPGPEGRKLGKARGVEGAGQHLKRPEGHRLCRCRLAFARR